MVASRAPRQLNPGASSSPNPISDSYPQ